MYHSTNRWAYFREKRTFCNNFNQKGGGLIFEGGKYLYLFPTVAQTDHSCSQMCSSLCTSQNPQRRPRWSCWTHCSHCIAEEELFRKKVVYAFVSHSRCFSFNIVDILHWSVFEVLYHCKILIAHKNARRHSWSFHRISIKVCIYLMSKNKVPSAYLDRKEDIVSWCSTLASQCELL